MNEGLARKFGGTPGGWNVGFWADGSESAADSPEGFLVMAFGETKDGRRGVVLSSSSRGFAGPCFSPISARL